MLLLHPFENGMKTKISKRSKKNLKMMGSIIFGIFVTYVIYILEEDFIRTKKLNPDYSNYS
jgi:hypothetical protein